MGDIDLEEAGFTEAKAIKLANKIKLRLVNVRDIISYIIGEMVEKGDIDLEEAGFTEAEAIKLADKIKLR